MDIFSTTFFENEDHSLKKPFSLKSIIASGVDINAVHEGQPWIVFLLKHSSYRDNIKKLVQELMFHPDLHTRTPQIQQQLLENSIYYPNSAKASDKKKSIFMSKFDLLTPIQAKNIRDEPFETPWLCYFLCNQSTFELFEMAYQYHPDFKAAIDLKDQQQNTLWHLFQCYMTQQLVAEDINHRALFDILFEHATHQLKCTNFLDLTPYETACKYYRHSDDKEVNAQFTTYMDLFKKLELYFELGQELPHHTNKIRAPKI